MKTDGLQSLGRHTPPSALCTIMALRILQNLGGHGSFRGNHADLCSGLSHLHRGGERHHGLLLAEVEGHPRRQGPGCGAQRQSLNHWADH